MDRPIVLAPLVCIQCQKPIPAEPDEIAWVCSQCGQGMILDEERGLLALQVHYQTTMDPNQKGKPYWVVLGKVSVQRKTYGANRDSEADQFWGAPRRFFIPAYSCTLDHLVEFGPYLLSHPLELQPGPAFGFESVTLAASDIQAVVEFIVMAIEAGRKDKLKEVQISVELSQPELWILPGAQ